MNPSTAKTVQMDVESQKPELPSNIDVFAPREGKLLTWSNVNMTLNGGKGETTRKLLDNVWGQVPKKQTTAIMGPSGAGKTSLLNILSGRASTNNKVEIQSDVRLDQYQVDATNMEVRKQIAFVAQEDSLDRTSTPREAIRFSAKLRLPKHFTDEQLDELTNRMLAELGLTHCADTVIGGGLLKGISGGEKKRTSVGVELVVKPSIVFLDEPTSGLDSYSAVQLCQVLKKVANAGASVLFTIHQPSSEIFNSFDHLLLLNKGRVLYQGSVDSVSPYFAERGYPVPFGHSTADWIINVGQSESTEKLEERNFFVREDKSEQTSSTGTDSESEVPVGALEESNSTEGSNSHVSLATECAMLFQREFRAIYRDTGATTARFGVTAFLAVLIGTIFYGVGESDPKLYSNVQSSFGALLVVGISAMMGSAQTELMQFPMTRPVFLREYSTNHYSVLSYFLSRFSVELTMTALQNLVMCAITYFMVSFQSNFISFFGAVYAVAISSTAISVFLGCVLTDKRAAQEMFPLLTVPQMLFAGFFVSPSLIPAVIRWAQYLCALTHSARILLITEFDRDCGSELGNENCQAVLNSVDANPGEQWKNWVGLVVIFLGYRLMGLFFLQRKGTKFFH